MTQLLSPPFPIQSDTPWPTASIWEYGQIEQAKHAMIEI